MPNFADIDRLKSKIADAKVVNLDAYRDAARRSADVSISYMDPRVAVASLLAALLVFAIIVSFARR